MLNHISIMGRLTKDPELRRTGSGNAVTSFTLACDRDFKNSVGNRETDWIDCVAFKNTAEFVEKYFNKGSMIIVAGKLQTRTWDDKQGNKCKSTEVICENVYFGEKKRDSGDRNDGNLFKPGHFGQPSTSADFVMLEDEDAELPF